MRRPRRTPLHWLLGLALPSIAAATTMRSRSADEMAMVSDAVVIAGSDAPAVGRARWSQGRIETELPVVVQASLRGPWRAGDSVTLRLPGGVVGEVAQAVAGAPVFRAGARYVLFLQRLPDGGWTVLDMSAGMLPIRVDPAGSLRVDPASTPGITFIGPESPRGVTVPAGGEALDHFVARLLRAVR